LIRYHGVFAPNARHRNEIALLPKEEEKKRDKKICRPAFTRLMARVFDINVFACPRCGSKMQVISLSHDLKVIVDILSTLKMSTAPPDVPEPAEYSIENDELAECYYEEF
jgi:hypothetical protein